MKYFLSTFSAAFICITGCAEQIETEVPLSVPEGSDVEMELVTSDVVVGWGMAFLPDGSLLVTERSGELFHVKEGKGSKVAGLPEIRAGGQGGLLDVILHPNYEETGWIYFSYSSPEGAQPGSNTAIMRAKLEDGRLVEQETVYKATPNSERGHHFGSRMAFDEEGMLYFSIGDRGDRDVNPQDITRDGGKIYRIHDDGTIPEDNPFVDEDGAKKAIFSYGHRNPQGMAIHPETGEVWIHEHGPRGGDEINIVKKGANYGWPVVTYGINYSGTSITDKTSMPGMEAPFFFWVPSIAPSGMAFVTSDRYPQWKGSLLVGALRFAYLERLEIEDGEVVKREKLLDGQGRLRDVRQGPDGYLYVSLEGRGIYRILPE
ncbi:PQQ-dependent sugar dehydrogenase [Pelagicoccus sp. SDUM812003]|uniref:PQQ-dependent sugar dehydrogenase n=1 Tax=Pelagicoccus sp. SDUM812003 TaxID=3041267 RepID=UPI00281057F8|nr:PQQ-dependent sugar dehydrogenase [Pelagicoccus sp. SDUM812003]MDQ8201809.1 PQQ-dependent sugar dehydrogenase [Pelagicoccus sp. SDUM812003]